LCAWHDERGYTRTACAMAAGIKLVNPFCGCKGSNGGKCGFLGLIRRIDRARLLDTER
jgi:hypothetical protein